MMPVASTKNETTIALTNFTKGDISANTVETLRLTEYCELTRETQEAV